MSCSASYWKKILFTHFLSSLPKSIIVLISTAAYCQVILYRDQESVCYQGIHHLLRITYSTRNAIDDQSTKFYNAKCQQKVISVVRNVSNL